MDVDMEVKPGKTQKELITKVKEIFPDVKESCVKKRFFYGQDPEIRYNSEQCDSLIDKITNVILGGDDLTVDHVEEEKDQRIFRQDKGAYRYVMQTPKFKLSKKLCPTQNNCWVIFLWGSFEVTFEAV